MTKEMSVTTILILIKEMSATTILILNKEMSATKRSWPWLRKSRASHPWNLVVAYKRQNLELVFNWWVFCCSFAFLKCVIFIFLFLIWTFFIFIKKTLIVSWCYFEKDFFLALKKIWFLKLGIGHWKFWK